MFHWSRVDRGGWFRLSAEDPAGSGSFLAGRDVQHVELDTVNRRAQQLVIRPGDTVEVTAVAEPAMDLHDESRGYRAEATRLMLRAPADDQILIRLVERRSR